uniref:Saposin B-type domain-containing protein n=1 Tax=Ciona savignyi TaxID=51511 RepID=H2ZIM3_CIOSA
MKILCAFFVLALVGIEVHGVALGADRCTWGPSYWCKNYGTAKTCGSVKHCKTNYWNKPVKNDEICNLCKEGMTVVDNYLKANATKAAIEAELLQICSDIPIPDLSTQCKQLITENFDMIYDEGLILVGNGDMVCTLIGLCTSSISEGDVVKQMVDNLPNIVRKAMENNELPIASPFIAPVPIFNQAPQQAAEGDCSDCQAFIKDVQNAIMNDPNMVKSWTGLMQNECDALGPGLSEICMQRSHEAINDIARYHMSDADAMSVCNTIKMCGFKSQKTVDNDMCTDCTRFFSDWKEMMMNNK